MNERDERYKVVVLTKRHPDDFRGPGFLRRLLSNLSEAPNTTIGKFPGMELEEAKEIAAKENRDIYTDGQGKLRTSKGVVVRID
jgi:hypothetical protein